MPRLSASKTAMRPLPLQASPQMRGVAPPLLFLIEDKIFASRAALLHMSARAEQAFRRHTLCGISRHNVACFRKFRALSSAQTVLGNAATDTIVDGLEALQK